MVGRDITVTVVDIRGDKIRLGITAPKEVPVHREEVFKAITGTSPVKPFVLKQRPTKEVDHEKKEKQVR